MGEVSYVDNAYITKTLSQYVNNGLDLGCSMTEVAKLLLLKRKEFEHEKEIRLIIFKESNYRLDHIAFSIDPQLFIDEITLDSRIAPNSSMFRNYKSRLLATGILDKKINRSILYDLPSPVNIRIKTLV